jgi:hypothetical protein
MHCGRAGKKRVFKIRCFNRKSGHKKIVRSLNLQLATIMARNLIAAVLLLAAIAGIAAQTADDGFAAPVMAETPAAQPGPMLINIEEPVPISVTEAPVAPAPLPSKPAFDANLLVKPEDITATMAFLDTVFKTDANVQQACLPQKIMVSAMSNLLVIIIPNQLTVV